MWLNVGTPFHCRKLESIAKRENWSSPTPKQTFTCQPEAKAVAVPLGDYEDGGSIFFQNADVQPYNYMMQQCRTQSKQAQ